MKKAARATLLLQHYQDTFANIAYHWRIRNRLFIYTLLLLAVMAFDTNSPNTVALLFNAYLAKTLMPNGGSPVQVDLQIVGSAIWFLLLSLVISYYQRSVYLDRQYYYIGDLENKLALDMEGDFITREGKSYNSARGAYNSAANTESRPLFLLRLGPLYTHIFPAVLVAFIVYKLLQEDVPIRHFSDLINLLIGGGIVFYNVLYVLWVRHKR